MQVNGKAKIRPITIPQPLNQSSTKLSYIIVIMIKQLLNMTQFFIDKYRLGVSRV